MTGIYYIVVCKIFQKKLGKYKIYQRPVDSDTIKHEIKWALLNKINFAIIGIFTYELYRLGHLKIYFDLDEYGIIYAFLIIPVLLIIQDTYFFWLHYLMHQRWFKRFSTHHRIHHEVQNVSPWSAFSVHPVEGFFEIALRPLILLFIPLHPSTLIIMAALTFGFNILGIQDMNSSQHLFQDPL